MVIMQRNIYYFQYRPNYTGFYGGNNLHYMPGKTGNNTSEIPQKSALNIPDIVIS